MMVSCNWERGIVIDSIILKRSVKMLSEYQRWQTQRCYVEIFTHIKLSGCILLGEKTYMQIYSHWEEFVFFFFFREMTFLCFYTTNYLPKYDKTLIEGNCAFPPGTLRIKKKKYQNYNRGEDPPTQHLFLLRKIPFQQMK